MVTCNVCIAERLKSVSLAVAVQDAERLVVGSEVQVTVPVRVQLPEHEPGSRRVQFDGGFACVKRT
jgi:hypothetical protein